MNVNKETIKKLKELDLPFKIHQVLGYLSKSEIYLVGGFVRDLILNKPSYDLDFILINENAYEFTSKLADKFHGKAILLDEDSGATRLVLKDEEVKNYSFDFISVSENKLEEDFNRRDFTVNALAIKLGSDEKLIDNFNGLKDLKEKKIKPIHLNNLIDDPLRMLRAFRCASQIDGRIDEEILLFIKNNLSTFSSQIASERIMVELWKLFESNNSYEYFCQLAEIGLLEKIIPELSPCKSVPSNDFHHLGLFDHSLYLLKTFEEQYPKISKQGQDILNGPFGEPDIPTKKAVSKFGCLLHDIGKPDTWEIKKVNGKEKHTFIAHDKVGAEITKQISSRLKLSTALTNTLAALVRHHLRPFQLSNGTNPITDRALYRFFRDIGDDTVMLLSLALADHYATLGPKADEEHLKYGESLILYLFDEYCKFVEKENEIKSKPKLLDGNEIMELTGIKPSKQLGEILKNLDEAISIGEVSTKEEAVKWLKSQLK